MTESTTIPVIRYAARSKTDEDRNESTASQVEQINAKVKDRLILGEAHVDYASGSKANRGPALAAAIDAATNAAEPYGAAELWVFHSSRLGRGTGKKGEARALGALLYELRAYDVTVRSVTDDEFVKTEQLWGIASNQSAKYSQDLSNHVRRGYEAAAQRGSAAWLAQGIRLGGYQVLKEFDSQGRVVHTAVKHPEDRWIYELIFEMALDGASAETIQLELSRRGARTRPSRRDHKPRAFDVNRVSQILNNASYAGLVVHRGRVVGPGQWPRYIEPEDFWRLQEERRARASMTKRRRGRPAGCVAVEMQRDEEGKRRFTMARQPYLLAELATCGTCGGPMRVETYRRPRQDGSRTRRYVCQAHREHHPESAEWCPARPIDAATTDALVLSGLDDLLSDAATLREQLNASRTVERERFIKIAEEAQQEAATADRVAEKAQKRYEAALEADDDEAAAINLESVRRKRHEAELARRRLNTALDALAAPAPENEGDALDRTWRVLSGRLADAEGDVQKLNAILRETFIEFRLSCGRYTGVRVVPVIPRTDKAGPAFDPGQASAVVLDENGEQVAVHGAHLTANPRSTR